MKSTKTIIGLLLAPAIAALVLSAVYIGTEFYFGMFLNYYLLNFIAACFIGIPLYMYLNKKQCRGFKHYLIAGLLISLLLPTTLLLVTYLLKGFDIEYIRGTIGINFIAICIFVFAGLIQVITFWYISIKEN